MWYSYIGENHCGWRLVSKADCTHLNAFVFGRIYNFVNDKGEFISETWFTWASNFAEHTQMATVHLPDGHIYEIDIYGNLVKKSEETLSAVLVGEIRRAINKELRNMSCGMII